MAVVGRKTAKGILLDILPPEILTDILSRLSFIDLFSCRCVCNYFLQLISNPDCLLALQLPTFLICGKTFKLYVDKYSSRSDLLSSKFKFKFPFSRLRRNLHYVGSHNGLVCLCHRIRSKDTIYIFNPIIGEYIAIPKRTKLLDNKLRAHYGFAFCLDTKQYKVVSMSVDESTDNVNVDILTLDTCVWKRHEKITPRSKYWETPMPFLSCLNGAFHWLQDEKSINVFHLKEGRIKIIPMPFDVKFPLNIKLKVLEDFLTVLDYGRDIDIWSMKVYGDVNSWTKKSLADMQEHTFKYVPSFISLKQIVKGEELEIKKLQ